MTIFKVQRSLLPQGARWLIYNEEQDQMVQVDTEEVPQQLVELIGNRLKMFIDMELDSYDNIKEVPDPGW